MDFVTARGYGPFHPYQAFEIERFENGPIGKQQTMNFCCRAIDVCDEFWLFGISEETLTELCRVLNPWSSTFAGIKPVRLFLDEFDPEWKTEYARLKDRFRDPLRKVNTKK